MAWVNAVCPTQYADLGIPNLQLMGFVLRLRWLWLARVDSEKTRSVYLFQADRSSQDIFDASITVQVGNGSVGHTPRVPMQGRMKTDSY
jgi:hypothetical protein